MKKATFKLEKFQSSLVETLEANQLKLIVGAQALAAMCSDTNDVDGKSDDCSKTGDTDQDPESPPNQY